MDTILTLFVVNLLQLLSIGISDCIELKTNPLVHKIHNAPDIMHMEFSKYGHVHAFMSGIKLAWKSIGLQWIVLSIISLIFESPNYMPIRLELLGSTINMTLSFFMVIGLWISIINVILPCILPWIFCVESDPYVIHRFLYSFNYGASMTLFLNFFAQVRFRNSGS